MDKRNNPLFLILYGGERIAGEEADLWAGAEDLIVQDEADVCGQDVVVSVEVDVLHAAKQSTRQRYLKGLDHEAEL